MSDPKPIGDDEIILRHIPAGEPWQVAGTPLTTANFRLRRGHTGVSVSRAALTTSAQLLDRVGGDLARGSKVAYARVGEVRALGLAVVPAPLRDDAGHAEIRSERERLERRSIQIRLTNLFRFME